MDGYLAVALIMAAFAIGMLLGHGLGYSKGVYDTKRKRASYYYGEKK